ncbi:type II secretion system protein N [Litorimonas sp. WD9-15]|uniref:type II secretion system protein N n=1 Tax=Litorimonas sp. WD9-15 TaxID=3418716 RepID=UPI003CFFC615
MTALRTVLNIASLVLVGVIGWLFVRVIVGLMNPESLYLAEPVIAPVATVASVEVTRNYDFSSDPFSLTQSVVADEPQLGEDAPETSLNLTLKGSTTASSAIIGMPDGQEKNIRIDEEIMNGVTLKGMGKDFVSLDVNGEVQRLTLERVKMEQQGKTPIIGRAPPKVSDRATLQAPSRAEAETLFTKVSIEPYFDVVGDGLKRRGFTVKSRAGADLSVFGLREGDILTRIGPVLLDRNRTNINELRELISTGAAQDIEVLRDGSPVTIRIGQ